MVKIKYSKLLKYPFLILLYTTIFFLFLLNFPKYISAYAEKENNESKAKIEYSLLKTKTNSDAQDTQDKDKDKEDKKSEDDKKDKKDKKDDKENKKPEAKIEYSLLEENIVAFDGSQSSDEDGTIVSYSWDFGDGSIGSGVTVTHTYNEPGNYKVTLTVTDDDGAYKKDVTNIKLKNKDNNIENISESNEFTQSKEEEKKEDFKNLNNDLSKLNEKLVKSYEKDIKQNKESILTGKYPEFILNFWNNIKEFAALYN